MSIYDRYHSQWKKVNECNACDTNNLCVFSNRLRPWARVCAGPGIRFSCYQGLWCFAEPKRAILQPGFRICCALCASGIWHLMTDRNYWKLLHISYLHMQMAKDRTEQRRYYKEQSSFFRHIKGRHQWWMNWSLLLQFKMFFYEIVNSVLHDTQLSQLPDSLRRGCFQIRQVVMGPCYVFKFCTGPSLHGQGLRHISSLGCQACWKRSRYQILKSTFVSSSA